jgi:hypothetical protein
VQQSAENYDHEYTFFGKHREAPGNLKDLNKMVQKQFQEQSMAKAKWQTSTQGRFMREGYDEPLKTIKYFKEELKGHIWDLV